jgi:hypothetical protein
MKKLLKITAVVMVTLAVLALALSLFIKSYLTNERLRALVTETAEKSINRKVMLGAIDFSLFRGIVVKDFEIREKDSEAVFLKTKEFVLNYQLIRIQALCPGFTRTEFHEVGDFQNFDRSVVPSALWMTAEDVLTQALAALERNKKVVFIPGWKNSLSIWLIRHSALLQSMTQKKVSNQNRKQVL